MSDALKAREALAALLETLKLHKASVLNSMTKREIEFLMDAMHKGNAALSALDQPSIGSGVACAGEPRWGAYWYGSEPKKGANIWTINRYGMRSDLILHIGPDQEHLDLARAICTLHNQRAALDQPSGVRAGVKPLVWDRENHPRVRKAYTEIGTYSAYADGTLTLDQKSVSFVAGREWHDTEAAAQADFEARIRSALDLSALGAEGWRTMAAEDVLAERERQKSVEGWTPEYDDQHRHGALANAAACYAISPHPWSLPRQALTADEIAKIIDQVWPWWGEHDNGDRIYWRGKVWFKPTDRRRDLVKAGALILAEIERLDRAAAAASPPEPRP